MAHPATGGGPAHRVVTLVVVGFAAAVVVVPLGRLVLTVVQETHGRLGAVLSTPGLGAAVVNTFVLALAVTAVAVPAGLATALALRRSDLPARRLFRVAVLLPVLVPPFVLGYSWRQAYGRAGITDTVVGAAWTGVQGSGGVFVVLVVNAVPLTYLLTAAGLAARAEPDLVRAARASGATTWIGLRTVTVPLLRPAIAAASVLVFVLTLESFAIPQVLGTPAGFKTVTTEIYTDLARSADPVSFVAAVTLALLLVASTAVVVVAADVLVGPRLRVTRVSEAPGTTPPANRSPGARWLAAALGGYLVLTVALPMLALLAAALTPAVGVPPTPANWTLDNLRAVLDTRTFDAMQRSFGLSLGAASLLAVLGGCLAVLERRRAGRALSVVVTLGLVMPGSTLAVALLISYGRWIGGTTAIILLAYLAKLWAFAHRPVSGALDRLPPDELRAARASGATALTSVRTIALPPLAPALLAGWLICFVTALHEVTMSSLLYGPGSETLAVVVLNAQELGRVGRSAAFSVVLTVAVTLPAVPLWVALRRLRTRT